MSGRSSAASPDWLGATMGGLIGMNLAAPAAHPARVRADQIGAIRDFLLG